MDNEAGDKSLWSKLMVWIAGAPLRLLQLAFLAIETAGESAGGACGVSRGRQTRNCRRRSNWRQFRTASRAGDRLERTTIHGIGRNIGTWLSYDHRCWYDYDRTSIGPAMSPCISVPAKTTATFGTGAVEGRDREQNCDRRRRQ
jgi:hypothetical protein